MKKYKVKIQKEKCIGCGICSSLSPDMKMSNEDGLVSVFGFEEKGGWLVGEINEDQLMDFEQASGACPQMIIKIEK